MWSARRRRARSGGGHRLALPRLNARTVATHLALMLAGAICVSVVQEARFAMQASDAVEGAGSSFDAFALGDAADATDASDDGIVPGADEPDELVSLRPTPRDRRAGRRRRRRQYDSPPRTILTASPDASTRSTDASFRFTCDQDGDCDFRLQLDGAGWLDNAQSPFKVPDALDEGWHTLRIVAVGRRTSPPMLTEARPLTFRWQVDTSAPIVRVLRRPPRASPTRDAAILLDTDKPNCLVEAKLLYRRDYDAVWSPAIQRPPSASDPSLSLSPSPSPSRSHGHRKRRGASTPPGQYASLSKTYRTKHSIKLAIGGMIEGLYEATLEVVDPAGNYAQPAVVVAWEVDVTAPTTEVVLAPRPLELTREASFLIRSPSEPGGTAHAVEYRLDAAETWERWNGEGEGVGEGVGKGEGEWGGEGGKGEGEGGEGGKGGHRVWLEGLADGPHVVHFRCVDAAGNADDGDASVAWAVHAQATQTTILSGPPKLTPQTEATFTVNASETQYS